MKPRMFIGAGPPGSGKSTLFPASGFGVDFFNADDHAATLNQDTYLNITPLIRAKVNTLFEAFVLDHIERRASCAFETTLRNEITFDHAMLAKRNGFKVEMRYLSLSSFDMHLERVKIRADKLGHSAPESVLRNIYDSSLKNLPRAIREMDFIQIYDSSYWGAPPTVLLQAEKGEIIYEATSLPSWLISVLQKL